MYADWVPFSAVSRSYSLATWAGDLGDDLILETESLSAFIARLDVERIASACIGFGTDDAGLQPQPYPQPLPKLKPKP